MLVVVITILTTLTTITAYAGGDDEDGNKQKTEDDSSAGVADCDKNDVEEARFLCIAIAANDVEIEPPEEEESTTLIVCKETSVENTSPSSFTFTVEGNNPDPEEFVGDDSDGCVDVTIGPGEYAVSEAAGSLAPGVEITGDCEQDPLNPQRATGEIEAGETEECTFINSPGAS
jgi:hypothetical protein